MPATMIELFDRLDELAVLGRIDEVESAALAALPQAHGHDIGDLWRYVAWARFEQRRLLPSLDAARRARDPLYEGKAHFHLWQFEAALDALFRFQGEGEDAAEAEWYLGILDEFAGRDPSAHFRSAARLAPGVFSEPVRLEPADVDGLIEEVLEALPPDVATRVKEAAIEVLSLPRPHVDVDPLSLGLHVERDGTMPAKVEIYLCNIERVARNRWHAIEELRVTLLHEFGHQLGFGEAGLDRLDLA